MPEESMAVLASARPCSGTTLDTDAELSRYIAIAFEPDDVLEIRAIDTSLSKPKQSIRHWFQASELPALPGLRLWNEAGRNIYVGVAARVARGQSGNQAFRLCRVVFADF